MVLSKMPFYNLFYFLLEEVKPFDRLLSINTQKPIHGWIVESLTIN